MTSYVLRVSQAPDYGRSSVGDTARLTGSGQEWEAGTQGQKGTKTQRDRDRDRDTGTERDT